MAMDSNNRVTCDHTGADLTNARVRIAAAVEFVPPLPGQQTSTLHFESWAAMRDYAGERVALPLHLNPVGTIPVLDALPAPAEDETDKGSSA